MRSTYISERKFTYDNGRKTSRHVLSTAHNQNTLRGFDVSNLSKGQITRIRNAWEKIQNQPWKLATKERKVMEVVGIPAKSNFRTFKTENIKSFDM
jgi:hypothetical protein|tara:strand:- start:349 stop:636 length:288 start_codon:yes stop_codon:yes gene_type:complete